MTSIPSRLLVLAAALFLVLGACGDDESGEQTAPAGPPDTTEADEAAEPAGSTATAGTGSGTVTIGETALPFDAEICGIEGGIVEVSGQGSGAGKSYEVTVTTKESSSGAVRESVRVVFSPQELATITNIYTESGGEPVFELGEGTLTGEGQFLSSGGAPAGPGTVEVSCDAPA
jgi:hypothetical protein